jgi:hypothetical protein
MPDNAARLARQSATQNGLLACVHPMQLEKTLRRIHANADNLVHGRLPLFEILNDLILAQSMPWGASTPTALCVKPVRAPSRREQDILVRMAITEYLRECGYKVVDGRAAAGEVLAIA